MENWNIKLTNMCLYKSPLVPYTSTWQISSRHNMPNNQHDQEHVIHFNIVWHRWKIGSTHATGQLFPWLADPLTDTGLCLDYQDFSQVVHCAAYIITFSYHTHYLLSTLPTRTQLRMVNAGVIPRGHDCQISTLHQCCRMVEGNPWPLGYRVSATTSVPIVSSSYLI